MRAIEIMDDFAERTGLTADRFPTRYLWTDAFAVCNWLGLHRETGDGRFLELATALVDQVHRVLGRHRPDDDRSGWISGATEAEGAEHPTAGGLRIGKPRNERAPGERYDPRAEWDRDGQYYHYLTKWMVALNRTWRETEDTTYHRYGVELARAVHAGFTMRFPVGRRLAWKMSIDLTRPLVPSSGHHDPLDGLITSSCLVATRPEGRDPTLLASEIDELRHLCAGGSWVTDDPLGIGGLLVDVLRCAQLAAMGNATGAEFLAVVLADCRAGLQKIEDLPFLRGPAAQRLAFRELGLALGLKAVSRLDGGRIPAGARIRQSDLDAVLGLAPAADRIVDFWSRDESRAAPTWASHRDISEVMWATCLSPDGFLEL